MKAITVAMEVKANGDMKEVFTMVHKDLVTAQKWAKDLPVQFTNQSYKTIWKTPRVKKANAIHKRGNRFVVNSYLFQGD